MKDSTHLTYSGGGTEPLQSNPKTLASKAASGSADGKPAGGTENRGAKTMVLSATAAKMAAGSDRKPKGVKTFPAGVGK